MRSLRTWSLMMVIVVSAGSTSKAGDIDPPGPPACTPAIEPRIAINQQNTPGDADALFIIDQPGSYYLAGNVSGEDFKHGIEMTNNGCLIRGISVHQAGFFGDGGTGILVSGASNPIEENHVTLSDFGFEIGGSGNLVVRNTASNNGNPVSPAADYVVAFGNDYANILILSGAGPFTNSNPWANLSH